MSTALAMFPFAIGSHQVYRVRIRLYEPVSGECLKAHAAQCRKRAGRRSLIIATEALALSDNEKPFRTCRTALQLPRGARLGRNAPPPRFMLLKARLWDECEFSRRMSCASMVGDQRPADTVDLKVMARAHAAAALKPRQLSASGQAEYLPGCHRYHKYCSSCVNEPADRQRR
jgi:hypothetical protein